MGKGGDALADGRPLSYLVRPAQDQFDFFAKAVPYLQAATDAELLANVEEYCDFLARQSTGDSAAAPSFKVELAWRTHLLMPVEYDKDCAAMCGGIISHTVLPVAEYPDPDTITTSSHGQPRPSTRGRGAPATVVRPCGPASRTRRRWRYHWRYHWRTCTSTTFNRQLPGCLQKSTPDKCCSWTLPHDRS
jgi:hypothetical protein